MSRPRSTRLVRATLAGILLPLAAIHSAGAQRGASRGSQAIRAEYAAVLLQAGRYPEAAQEFRTLLAASPRQLDYRLGLARALAWGGQPRDAERELRALQAQRPTDPVIGALLRSTRESYEPTAREAEQWVADAPTFAPYRLALARSLVREHEARASLPHYDLLLVLGRPIESRPVTSSSGLLREAAEARAAAGDRSGSVRLLREALVRSSGDTAVRHGLAVILAGGGALDESLAQYDTLLAAPAELTTRASLQLERAQLNVTRGDLPAAERDAKASLATKQTAGGYLLLGDLGRWRGEYADSRSAYERARVLEPGSRAVTAAFGRLARDEHPAMAFAPMETGEEGWRVEGSAIRDNLGVRYVTAGAHRGVALPAGFTAGAGVEYRDLSDHRSTGTVAMQGYAAELGAAREGQVGALYGRLGAHGAIVSHPGLGVFPEGSVSIASWYGAWGVGLDLRSVLAYPSLLTIGSLRPSLAARSGTAAPTDEPLRAQTVTASIAGPIARADLALVGQRTRISDGNVRSTLQLFARLPVAPRLSILYAGSGVQFAERSTLYWDPVGYVSNATGIEYAVRRALGFTYAVQALPGIAWSNELPLATPGVPLRRTAPQFTGSGDASYRAERWDVGAALTYSRGRAGDYEQLGGSIQLRVHP